jgi:arabinofuranosyltransferase
MTLLLPVFVVPMDLLAWNRATAMVAGLMTAAWAVASVLLLHVSYRGTIGPQDIADERGFWVSESGSAHPVTLQDYAALSLADDGWRLSRLADSLGIVGPGQLRIDLGPDLSAPPSPSDPFQTLPARRGIDPRIRLIVGRWNVGITGVAAGPHVHLVDRLGLADPIASRLALGARGRVGHEKVLPNQWILARWSDEPLQGPLGEEVAAARRVLSSPNLLKLERSISGGLSAAQFLRNLAAAPALTALRIPANPMEAAGELPEPTGR